MNERIPPRVLEAMQEVLRQRGILDHFLAREKELGAKLSRSVRPLLSQDERGRSTVTGSCALVQFGGRFFIFTAAHVLDEAMSSTLSLADFSGLVELSGALHQTDLRPLTQRRDDRFDVGFMEIPSDIAVQLDGCCFLTKEDIDPDDRPGSQRFYLSIGYPARISGRDHHTKKIRIKPMSLTSGADHRVYEELGVRPFSHLAVKFDRERTVLGEHYQTAPKPHGMSGGGVWRFDSMLPSASINNSDKLVGILIEHRDSSMKLMLATRIVLFLEALRTAFPELDSEIPKCTTGDVNISYAQNDDGPK